MQPKNLFTRKLDSTLCRVVSQLGVTRENEGEKFIDVFLYEITFKNNS